MKWVFFLLLLVNAAYWGWETLLPAAESSSAQNQTPAHVGPGKKLVKVSEVAAEQLDSRHSTPPSQQPPTPAELPPTVPANVAQKEAVTTVAEPAPQRTSEAAPEPRDEPAMRCIRVTDLGDDRDAAIWRSRMEQAGFDVIRRGEEKIEKTNYWVLIPPYSDRSSAEKAVTQMERSRVRDLYVVRSGSSANAISLGVFSSLDAAKSRVASIVRIKLDLPKPKIELLKLPAKRRWFEFASNADTPESAWKSVLEGANDAPQWREVACQK